MSDSCCSGTQARSEGSEQPSSLRSHSETVIKCPSCGEKGKFVPGQTVKAMLAVSLRQLQEAAYYFCRTPTCAVVYFSADGQSVLTKSQLREPVYQKESGVDDVFVCYCFQYTAADLRNATPEGRNAIVEDINAGIQANQCACDLRNPQGTCCLGNVRKFLAVK